MGTSFVDADAATDDIARRRQVRWNVVIPAALFGAVVLAALIGPFFAPDPYQQDLRNARLPMFSPGHIFGTDAYGRDVCARVLVGARVSLVVGFSSVALCLLLGGVLGLIAGYRGGWLDSTIMRFMDMVLAFPTLVLALAVAAFLGPSLRNVVFAVAFAQLPHYARLGRATTVTIRERDFVLSAQLLGARERHIIGRHVLPNVVAPITTYGLLAVSIAILVEASLSFLGLGVRPPTPSWGAMIAEARPDLQAAPHLAFVPGAFLFVTTLSINLIADGIRSKATMAGGDQ